MPYMVNEKYFWGIIPMRDKMPTMTLHRRRERGKERIRELTYMSN